EFARRETSTKLNVTAAATAATPLNSFTGHLGPYLGDTTPLRCVARYKETRRLIPIYFCLLCTNLFISFNRLIVRTESRWQIPALSGSEVASPVIFQFCGRFGCRRGR